MTIIALPTVSPARLGRPASTASDPRLVLPCRTVQRLLSEIDETTMVESEDWEQTVAMLLAQSLAAPGCLAGLPWGEGRGGRPARLDLAQTQSLRIFARRWQPGQMGPLRRFMDWFAYGAVEGRLVELTYPEGHTADEASGEVGILPATCRVALRQGEVRHGPGDGRRLRRLGNLSAEIAMSLHIEGLPQPSTATTPVLMPVAATSPLLPRPRLTVIAGGRKG